MSSAKSIKELRGLAKFSLFISSYIPLFVLIILKQINDNWSSLHYGGISFSSISVFTCKFGLSVFLLVLSMIGLLGLRLTLMNLERSADNGFPATIVDVKNKNSEAIGYIATYIIPFLFQNIGGIYEFVSIIFLLIVIYNIYVNSSLLLINPLLSISHALYEIEYMKNNEKKNGLVISKNKYLEENSKVKLNEIGHKLYYLIEK